jgi:hypothetical protein
MNHRYGKSPDGGNTTEDLRGETQFTASLAALLGMLRNHPTDRVEQGVRQPQDHERNNPRNGGFDR